MSFPIAPSNGDIHNDYKYSDGMWNIFTEPDDIESVKKTIPTASGIKEVFRCAHESLTTAGLISLAGEDGTFSHSSSWLWSSNHQGVGYGTLKKLNQTGDDVTIYLDVQKYGAVIFSTGFNRSMNFDVVIKQFHGGALDFSATGILHATPDTDYARYTAI